MAETVNIAGMAEMMSSQIFSKIGWELHGPPNESWECVVPAHGKQDHPTDATFVYEDPYTGKNVHLITDLKSYAVGSIQRVRLKDSIESLALAIECAKQNPNWRKLYLKAGREPEVQGLFFVYNHDNQYDRNFPSELNEAFDEGIVIPSGVRISVLGPDDVWYVNEILNDIAILSRNGDIPREPAELSFFYPSRSRRQVASLDRSPVATIDVLKGKYQLLTFQKESERGMLVYYRGPGKDEREFIVLIDMLRVMGAIDNFDVIHVRCARALPDAAVQFSKAISQYAQLPQAPVLGKTQPPERLKKLKFASVASVRPQLTQYEVAMRSSNA